MFIVYHNSVYKITVYFQGQQNFTEEGLNIVQNMEAFEAKETQTHLLARHWRTNGRIIGLCVSYRILLVYSIIGETFLM